MLQPRINQIPMKYALQIGEIPEFETEYYEDKEGNKFPMSVDPTGKTEVVYSEPVSFLASISMSGGEAEAVEYGLSTESFEAIIVYSNGAVPLTEGSLIWIKSEPQFKHIEIEVDENEINGDFPIATSADFRVIKINESINFTRAILRAVNK